LKVIKAIIIIITFSIKGAKLLLYVLKAIIIIITFVFTTAKGYKGEQDCGACDANRRTAMLGDICHPALVAYAPTVHPAAISLFPRFCN